MTNERQDFAALNSPLRIGTETLRNRLVMAPMCAMYAAADGSASQQLIEYYRARAAGGVGMVIVELTFVDDLGSRAFHAQLGAHSDLMIPGLNELAEAIRSEGAVAGIQLAHSGAQRVISDPPVVAPSPIPWMRGKRVPEELTTADIDELIENHIAAAKRVADAGFDLIEIHGAHGYLVNTFLCPTLNRRSDRYGGSFENRLRFPLEIVRGIKAEVGDNCLVSMRLNGDDQLDGGLGIEQYIEVAKILQDAGLDVLHASAGTYRVMEQRITPMYLPEGPFLSYAKAFTQALDVPVIASGTLHDLETNERLVKNKEVDMVSLARPLFADPRLPRKLFSNRRHDIIPCIRCNTCLAREQGGARGRCAVNPETGREFKPHIPAAKKPRRVVIVGAGPAGIQAAISASQRGHHVELVDRADRLGGQLALASNLDFKSTLKPLLAHYERRISQSDVALRLETDFLEIQPSIEPQDIVVCAIGSNIPVPPEFLDATTQVISATRAIEQPGMLGDEVTVVGANLLGVETAMYMGQLGLKVQLLEQESSYSKDVNLINQFALPELLERSSVNLHFETKLEFSSDGGFQAVKGNSASSLNATSVVLAYGRTPSKLEVAPQWQGEIRSIGECAGNFGLYWATKSGDHLGRSI